MKVKTQVKEKDKMSNKGHEKARMKLYITFGIESFCRLIHTKTTSSSVPSSLGSYISTIQKREVKENEEEEETSIEVSTSE